MQTGPGKVERVIYTRVKVLEASLGLDGAKYYIPNT